MNFKKIADTSFKPHCGFFLTETSHWAIDYPSVTIETKATSNPHCGFFLSETSGLYPPVTIETKATSNPHYGFLSKETSDWAIILSNHRNRSHIQSTLLVFL